MAVRSLIKRLLVYGKGRRQEIEFLDREEHEWQVGTSTSQHKSKEESCREELDRAIQMVECIYNLDGPDDLPESLELVEFLCTELDKPPPEVQDPLEVINLGTEEDPRPIQISGLLGVDDRARIICLLQEFKDCFAWHYTEMPGNINGATPKDEYPMPMVDLSIDAVPKHKVLSFMDGNAGYNQIKMAPEDIHKTAFRCPGHVGAYEYLVMPFGLKNAGATYQRAMNAIFHDLIGQSMEVYIDDIVVKSKTEEQHLEDLKQTLAMMRIHKLKMNPKKCAFGVRAGNFLGFLVHQRGVEVDKNKSRAIMGSPSPTNKVQLQRLLGKINFLRRLFANLAGKIQPLTHLLRLKDKENFEWGPPHQQAFDNIKAYLTSPPVLVPPQRGKPLKLYISTSEKSIGSLLAQNNEGGKEQAVYYLSRILTEVETRYSPVERLCLALYFTANYQGNTNNRAEYEALIIGLEILMDLGAVEVEVFGDSELVINQLNGEFKCRHITMTGYYLAATQLLSFWDSEISVNHVPRGSNLVANEMAQLASGVPIQERKYGVDVEIQRRNLPSILERGFSLDIMVLEAEIEDWRSPIIHHLKDPSSPTSKKNRQQATKYVLWAKNLLRKTPDGLLLKCLGQEESMRVMAEVHEGVCGAHQAGTKMRWLLRRYGYFWPDMEKIASLMPEVVKNVRGTDLSNMCPRCL
ncbi:uncharacterized protein [Malus domestica]|uniref:uncharacterized protein n=1 Tax=Malus domestica TaxID=3750 RepID=UPI003976D160